MGWRSPFKKHVERHRWIWYNISLQKQIISYLETALKNQHLKTWKVVVLEKLITDQNHKRIIASKIIPIEQALNLSSEQMAVICEVSDTTIYRMEKQSFAGISENLLITISEKTCVDRKWLLDCENESVDPVWAVRGIPIDGTNSTDVSAFSRVRIVRKSLSMTQPKFAEAVGISRAYLIGIENGYYKLTDRTARKIAERFNHISEEWLMKGKESSYLIGEQMIDFLRRNKEVRKLIWNMMEKYPVKISVKKCRLDRPASLRVAYVYKYAEVQKSVDFPVKYDGM